MTTNAALLQKSSTGLWQWDGKAETLVEKLLAAESEAVDIKQNAKEVRQSKVRKEKEKAQEELNQFKEAEQTKLANERDSVMAAESASTGEADQQRALQQVELEYNQNKDATVQYILSRIRDVNLNLTQTQTLTLANEHIVKAQSDEAMGGESAETKIAEARQALQRISSRAKVDMNTVRVVIKNGCNFAQTDWFSSADFYVNVQINRNGKKLCPANKTRVISDGSASPEWNEEFIFEGLGDASDCRLVMHVLDKDSLLGLGGIADDLVEDDKIGMARVAFADCTKSSGFTDRSVKLTKDGQQTDMTLNIAIGFGL